MSFRDWTTGTNNGVPYRRHITTGERQEWVTGEAGNGFWATTVPGNAAATELAIRDAESKMNGQVHHVKIPGTCNTALPAVISPTAGTATAQPTQTLPLLPGVPTPADNGGTIRVGWWEIRKPQIRFRGPQVNYDGPTIRFDRGNLDIDIDIPRIRFD